MWIQAILCFVCSCVLLLAYASTLASALNFSCFLFFSMLVLKFVQSYFSRAPLSAICLLYWPSCCLYTQFSHSFWRKWSVAKHGSVCSWMGCLAGKCFTTAAGLASFKCVIQNLFNSFFFVVALKILRSNTWYIPLEGNIRTNSLTLRKSRKYVF